MADNSCVDVSFAKLALQYAQAPTPALKQKLLANPALKAIARHRGFIGAEGETTEAVLDSLDLPKKDFLAVSGLIKAVEKDNGLCRLWKESAKLLPPGFTYKGKIFFILGYDIGAASPPDVLINLANSKFIKAPSEIAPYIIHEIYHVGFFQFQPVPSLLNIDQQKNLLQLIEWSTQSEGMAVNAAYEYRREHHLLRQDEDYGIYSDEAERKKVLGEYSALYRMAENSKSPVPGFGAILTKMSSGQRLWYRFGAWLARSIEQKYGRTRLIESVSNPLIFWEQAKQLVVQYPATDRKGRTALLRRRN